MRRKVLRTGDPDAVHDLRVALRRLRLLALVGRPLLGRTRTLTIRQRSFRVMEALGEVRDCDVALEWLGQPPREQKLRQALERLRARRWRSRRPELLQTATPDWQDLGTLDTSKSAQRKFARRFAKHEEAVLSEVRRLLPQFERLSEDDRHNLRRVLRRWRYLKESALSRKQQQRDVTLRRVIALQEALGEMQNCDVIRKVFGETRGRPTLPRLVARLTREKAQWERKARERLRRWKGYRPARRKP